MGKVKLEWQFFNRILVWFPHCYELIYDTSCLHSTRLVPAACAVIPYSVRS